MKTLLATLCVLVAVTAVVSDGVVLCYWGAYANSRSGVGRFGASDLPTDLCTHIVYAFIGLNPEGEITYSEYDTTYDGKTNNMSDFVALKEQNSALKLMIAVGGWNEASANFSKVTNNDTLRATFVANVVTFLDTNGLDGFDVDWEYPNQRENSSESDREAFIYLLQDLKTAFKPSGYLLTVAVGATQSSIDLSYLVSNISDTVDYINIMAYDFHGSWDSVTGVNAPLYPQLSDAEGDVLNVNTSLNAWLDNGASASKILLGLASYGHSFILESLDDVGTGASISGVGTAGPSTQEAGILAYYEICLNQTVNEWNITNVDNSYVYGNSEYYWAGYDDVNTIRYKAQYARKNSLGGIFFWAVDLDDFSGICSNTIYPLIKAGIEGFKILSC